MTSGGIEFGAAWREDLEGVAGLAAATLREAWSETGFAEMLGMPGAQPQEYVKRYAEVGKIAERAVRAYCRDVRLGRFPSSKYAFKG